MTFQYSLPLGYTGCNTRRPKVKGYLLLVDEVPQVSYLKASEAFGGLQRAKERGHKARYVPIMVAA